MVRSRGAKNDVRATNKKSCTLPKFFLRSGKDFPNIRKPLQNAVHVSTIPGFDKKVATAPKTLLAHRKNSSVVERPHHFP